MKKLTAYIGKTLKAGVVLAAAVAFVSGSLLCCCLTKTAHASAQPKACCHKHQTAKADPSKTCEHCKIRASLDLAKAFDLLPSLAKHLHHAWIADALVYRLPIRIPHLAYTGPPRAPSSLPVYLQFSCLRL
jgi:hypothetical protein